MGRLQRAKLPIPFGEGLDRATGVTRLQPTQFEDLRNVILFDGKAQIRKGYELTSTLVDNVAADLDITLQLAPLRTEGAAMGVGFDDTSKELFLNRLSILGTNPTAVLSGDANGRLFLLDGSATFDPPILHMVDTFGRMYIAHDEPLLAARNATRVYNPNVAPQIDDLTGDLDDDDVTQPIRFRGITRHLSYLVGWGYGTDADQDRPDVVRVSLAGDPDIFDPRHFFLAGQRSEPVLTCRTAGPLLLVFKETESYEIFGYSPETFGIRPADTLFGCVGSRLAVTVANTVFFWSTQGPRMSAGGESTDLAMPLDIGGPEPATLVAESDPEQAFAVYSAIDRTVMWVWGRRVYVLSLRMPSRVRWSYFELGAGAEPYCGAEFFTTLASGGGGAAPTGWPIIQDEATGVLTLTGQPADTETVTIDTKVYTFQTVLTNVDGNVLIGATPSDSLDNLIAAIILGAGAGVDYAAATTLHPTVTAAAGPGDTMDATSKTSGGSSIATTTTVVLGSWGAATLTGGLTLNDTSIEIEIFNTGGGGLGSSEVLEVHVKDVDGTDMWAKRPDISLAPARGAGAPNFEQTVVVDGLKAANEYEVSLRYRGGGQFTPGFVDSNNPQDWNDPACPACPDDPPAFRAGLFTTVTAPILTTRAGDNGGLWERLDATTEQLTVPIEVPAGHEELVMEVQRQRQTISDTGVQDINGMGRPGGANQVVEAFTVVEAALAAGSSSYLDEAITGEQLHNYRVRFLSPGNAPDSEDSNILGCHAGPDPPFGSSLSCDSGVSATSTWSNTSTPTTQRFCPAPRAGPVTAPSDHNTEGWMVNVTQSGSGDYLFTPNGFQEGSHLTSGLVTILVGVEDDIIRVGVRHRTQCDGVDDYSRWSLDSPAQCEVPFTGGP